MGATQLALAGLLLAVGNAGAVESKVCGECHADLCRRYLETPMAKTSGAVNAANAPSSGGSDFIDEATGTRIRILREGAKVRVHLSRGEADVERELNYFVGAGLTGRSYLSRMDGYLFQAPVSYYSAPDKWDLSPGFEGLDRLNLTRPVEPACLNCHASGLRNLASTVNGYESPPFVEAGVSCERCHGPGEAHVKRMRAGDGRGGSGIVNPAKLAPAERDSVCAQCHLVSVIRVAKPAGVSKYEAGKRLFDSTAAFLWSNGVERNGANSHFEQLVSSACWKNSAGKLWCGSCHSVHAQIAGSKPASKQSPAYREHCLACHTASARDCSAQAGRRQAAKDDCASCHMPARPIGTVAHAVQVDHRIARAPSEPPEPALLDDALLISFPGSTGGDRELGLAYASEALPENHRAWGMRAFSLLKQVAAAHAEDGAVAVQLAQLYDRMGQEEEGCNLFERAVKSDAPGTAALVNLGACQAKRADLADAMRSWKQALQRNPALEAARLNLAVAQQQSGDAAGARASLEIALKFDPFSVRAQELLRSMPAK
jgi:hypothetical protein